MWVSGSLIRSSTWRSSSVSAPCISSSICLPSSPERSRTMRGSFCQALPIGCMRVFMTPSCSSAVTLESRCSGTLNSVSSLRREISSSWLRVKHQLGDHGHQVFQRIHVDADRLVGDLVALGHVAVGRRQRAPCAAFFGASSAARPARARRRVWLRAQRVPTSVAVSRKARSSSSSETSPGRSGRSRVWSISVPLRHLWAGSGLQRGGAATPRGGRPRSSSRQRRSGRHRGLPARPCFQLIDQILVGAFGLGLGGLEACQNLLDAVDRGQDQRHGLRGHRHAVAELAHQRLAGMRQRFQPRQPEEAAGALDGVDQAENVIQDLGVVRLLLEPHQLIVDRVQAFAGLGQKLPQQIIHETGLRTHRRATSTRLLEFGQLLCKAFNIG